MHAWVLLQWCIPALCLHAKHNTGYSTMLITIKVYLAAVRNLHLEAEFPHVFENLNLLPRLVSGIKRVYSRDSRPRLPITPQILLTFNTPLHLQWQDHNILWSAMVIAFFTFLRSSKLLALQRKDVTIIDYRNNLPIIILVFISAPQRRPILPECHGLHSFKWNPDLRPAKALLQLINQPYVTHPDSPLLQWCRLTRWSLNNTIKWLVHNLNENHFSTRTGTTTTTAAAGITDALICMLGRCSNDAYLLYVCMPNTILDTVPCSLVSQTNV